MKSTRQKGKCWRQRLSFLRNICSSQNHWEGWRASSETFRKKFPKPGQERGLLPMAWLGRSGRCCAVQLQSSQRMVRQRRLQEAGERRKHSKNEGSGKWREEKPMCLTLLETRQDKVWGLTLFSQDCCGLARDDRMEGKKGTSKTRMPIDLVMFITELDSWPPFSERREKEKKKAGKERRKRNQEK